MANARANLAEMKPKITKMKARMAKMRAKMVKMKPKMEKMRPRMAKMRPKMAKMRSKMAKMRLKMATSSTHPDGQDEARDGQDEVGGGGAPHDEAQERRSYKHRGAYFKKLRRPGHRSVGTTSTYPIDVGAEWGPRRVRGGSKTSQERRWHHLKNVRFA